MCVCHHFFSSWWRSFLNKKNYWVFFFVAVLRLCEVIFTAKTHAMPYLVWKIAVFRRFYLKKFLRHENKKRKRKTKWFFWPKTTEIVEFEQIEDKTNFKFVMFSSRDAKDFRFFFLKELTMTWWKQKTKQKRLSESISGNSSAKIPTNPYGATEETFCTALFTCTRFLCALSIQSVSFVLFLGLLSLCMMLSYFHYICFCFYFSANGISRCAKSKRTINKFLFFFHCAARCHHLS